MPLIEIHEMPIHDRNIYDANGRIIGQWYRETGKGMLYDCLIAKERLCHDAGSSSDHFHCSVCGFDDSCCHKEYWSICPSCGAVIADD